MIINTYHHIENSAQAYPDKAAIIFQGKEISYREPIEQVCWLSSGLRKLWVNMQDRVAILVGIALNGLGPFRL